MDQILILLKALTCYDKMHMFSECDPTEWGQYQFAAKGISGIANERISVMMVDIFPFQMYSH